MGDQHTSLDRYALTYLHRRFTLYRLWWIVVFALGLTHSGGAAQNMMVNPVVIGVGEQATVQVGGFSFNNGNASFQAGKGFLGPMHYARGGYETTLSSSEPGSTLITFRLTPWSQIEAVGVAHFRAPLSSWAPSIFRSRDTISVSVQDDLWLAIVDDGITVTGAPLGATLDRAQARIADGYIPSEDALGLLIDGTFVQTYSSGGISVTYEAGTLTMVGTATVDAYVALLQRVAYHNAAPYPDAGARTIEFKLGPLDGDYWTWDPEKGRYYEYVAEATSWDDALTLAARRSLFGMQGYLATITSAEENELVGSISYTDVWIGISSYYNLYGGYHWWVSGPEAGTVASRWKNPYLGAYTNWADWVQHNNDPNGQGRRDRTFMYGLSAPAENRFQWVNPGNNDTVNIPGYIVEYGGFPGDPPPPRLVDTVILQLHDVPRPPAPDAEQSTITVAPAVIVADGMHTANVTVTVRDGDGNPFPLPYEPHIIVRHANVGSVLHKGGGVYVASLTSHQPGTSQIAASFEGAEIARGGLITFRRPFDDGDLPALVLSRNDVDLGTLDNWVVLDPHLLIDGMAPGAFIDGAQVEIAQPVDEVHDELGFVIEDVWVDVAAFHQAPITASYNGETGRLTLTGSAPWETYEGVLRSVAFRHHDTEAVHDDLARKTTFTVTPAVPSQSIVYSPSSGHYYEYVPSANIRWSEAEKAAAQRMLFGQQGYLATITSAHENDVITALVPKTAWIGGSDYEQPERWRWMTGPETGQLLWLGLADGTGVPGSHNNWAWNEPNHLVTDWGEEHYVEIFGPEAPGALPDVVASDVGKWNDLPDYHETWVDGYVVEYGGLPGDPGAGRLTASVTVHMVVSLTPRVDFRWAPVGPRFGEEVAFENLSTVPRGWTPSYTWTFGDGTSTNTEHPFHVFSDPGTYEVTLTVTSGDGWSDSLTQSVSVTADMTGYVFHDEDLLRHWAPGLGGVDDRDLAVALVRAGQIVAIAPDAADGHTFNRGTGQYVFHRVPAGDYEVMVIGTAASTPYTPPGWVLTTHLDTPREVVSLGDLPPADVQSTLRGPDFGFARQIIVSGSVFLDDGRNGGVPNDGDRQPPEIGLAGQRLRLLNAADHPVATTVTDGQGNFTLPVDPFIVTTGDGLLRLVVDGSAWRTTGYTPGPGVPSVQLDAFRTEVDVPVAFGSTSFQYSDYRFGLVPSMTGGGSLSGLTTAGGVHVYPFAVTPGTRGELAFHINSPRGWSYAVYADPTGGGTKRPGMVPVTEPMVVVPGLTHFLLEVRVPAGESVGATDATRIHSTLLYDGTGHLSETISLHVLTGVSGTRLKVTAYVRNVTRSDPYTATALDAEAGDVLEYRIDYVNVDSTPAFDVALYAGVPPYTTLQDHGYEGGFPLGWMRHTDGVFQPAGVTVTPTGFAFDVGDVAPGESGHIVYKVLMD